ncbi:MAG: SUMF1/EgtB/PvdO family nonheme iron enzyme, partial [Anaerolineae bacterium]|nr:SUMF1/EgtB/PvdO family nonheme iron enzyme [Anaerolineae bacterium]
MNLNRTPLGQYQLLEPIGKGGMGQVYKAYQPTLDRHVAIKVLSPHLAHTPDFLTRFEREAKTIAKLRHRNILTIFDYGHQDELCYLVMEYVPRGTLRERLGWPQDLGYTVSLISQLGAALEHAHRAGIVHRDIKPANILVAEEDWFLLSDFGLVKMVEESGPITVSGASLGTPHYMSPEQAQGLAVDPRSDLYSLGLVLYEAVTGQMPFDVDSPVVVLMKHISEPIAPPRTLRSDMPEAMEQVILKALAKSPDERYPSMAQFVAALQAAYAPSPGQAIAGPRSPGNFETQLPAGRETISIAAPRVTPPTAVRLPAASPPSAHALPWVSLTVGAIIVVTLALGFILLRQSLPAQATAATRSPTPAADAATDFVAPPAPTIEMRVWTADQAEMVFVPAGPFTMGSTTLGDDERPVRQVELDAFWLDRTEVTNAQFARFVAGTGHRTEAEQRGWGWVWSAADSTWRETSGADWQHPAGPVSDLTGQADHPVVLVSWADAVAYCRWAGKRLPSEAEWEKAAGGVTFETIKPDYPWGSQFDPAKANTKEAQRGGTTPVGSFSPGGDSRYGAADMTGNVWEWVSDWYAADAYRTTPATNPTGPATGSDKVLRGGSWLFEEIYARTAARYNLRPDYTYDFTGFRCASSD